MRKFSVLKVKTNPSVTRKLVPPPADYNNKTKFDTITFDEVLARRLKVMDQTAFTLCRENHLSLIVFDMDTPGNLEKVIVGENIGTIVTE